MIGVRQKLIVMVYRFSAYSVDDASITIKDGARQRGLVLRLYVSHILRICEHEEFISGVENELVTRTMLGPGFSGDNR